MENAISLEDQIKANAETNEAYYKRMEAAGKKSAADYTFFDAARKARVGAEAEGLMPYWHDFEWHYDSEKATKTIFHTREDVIALSHIQYAILKRLDRNRNYMVAIIGLLIYIANKFN